MPLLKKKTIYNEGDLIVTVDEYHVPDQFFNPDTDDEEKFDGERFNVKRVSVGKIAERKSVVFESLGKTVTHYEVNLLGSVVLSHKGWYYCGQRERPVGFDSGHVLGQVRGRLEVDKSDVRHFLKKVSLTPVVRDYDTRYKCL